MWASKTAQVLAPRRCSVKGSCYHHLLWDAGWPPRARARWNIVVFNSVEAFSHSWQMGTTPKWPKEVVNNNSPLRRLILLVSVAAGRGGEQLFNLKSSSPLKPPRQGRWKPTLHTFDKIHSMSACRGNVLTKYYGSSPRKLMCEILTFGSPCVSENSHTGPFFHMFLFVLLSLQTLTSR